MDYRFHRPEDERLIELSNLPVEKGIAVSMLTTGYDADEDEIVDFSIVDFARSSLLACRVNPQNIEEWQPSSASGGLSPTDVEDCPELYQFEEAISDAFENASIVVAEHLAFARTMVEASWVSLPEFNGFDLVEEFCATHSTADAPDEPATVAALDGIAAYYDVELGDMPTSRANATGLCYLKLVEECAREHDALGARYWEDYRRRKELAQAGDRQLQAAERNKQIKTLRINAVMWLCAAAIFSNLAVQLYVRSFDIGVVVLVAAAAIFTAIRWIRCLYAMYKLRKQS